LAEVWGNDSGSAHAARKGMRGLVIFLVIAGIGGGLFFLQKRSEQKNAAVEASAQSSPVPRQISEHDWAKHSLEKFSSKEKTTT